MVLGKCAAGKICWNVYLFCYVFSTHEIQDFFVAIMACFLGMSAV